MPSAFPTFHGGSVCNKFVAGSSPFYNSIIAATPGIRTPSIPSQTRVAVSAGVTWKSSLANAKVRKARTATSRSDIASARGELCITSRQSGISFGARRVHPVVNLLVAASTLSSFAAPASGLPGGGRGMFLSLHGPAAVIMPLTISLSMKTNENQWWAARNFQRIVP